MSRIFLDTAPIIYLIDADARYLKKMQTFISDGLQADTRFITSTITCEEYLVYPYKTKNLEKIKDFYTFISECNVQILDIDLEIADKAASIRAEFPAFKPMDSFQLATAAKANCDIFLTNDKQLKQYDSILVQLIEDS